MPVRLLVAFDGSDAAEAAVATAGALFGEARGQVLTVFDPPMGYAQVLRFGFGLDAQTMQRGVETLRREVEDAAHETAERGVAAAAAVGLTLEPKTGPADLGAWRAILSTADEIDADVIACGSRGQGGVARSLLGSISSGVLHHASRPVLVVPHAPAELDGPALIAYDGSPDAKAAIARSGSLLRGRRATIVNVWRSPIQHTLSGRVLTGAPMSELREFASDYEAMFADAAGALVEEGVALARDAGFDASGKPLESGAGTWRALGQAAGQHGAAVIVAGSTGRGAVASAVLGSVSSGLVHNAETPTLVIPGG
jgi:nucleotide-binding universal stress UspA family protein